MILIIMREVSKDDNQAVASNRQTDRGTSLS